MEKFKIEEKIVAMLKTVYDPEIPVNVYDLGLIYKIDVSDNGEAVLDMTLTAPNCPAADFIMEDIRQKVESVEGVTTATINLVFEPEWDKDMMSEEAKLELGFLYIHSSKYKTDNSKLKTHEERLFPFRCASWFPCHRTWTYTGTALGELPRQYQA